MEITFENRSNIDNNGRPFNHDDITPRKQQKPSDLPTETNNDLSFFKPNLHESTIPDSFTEANLDAQPNGVSSK